MNIKNIALLTAASLAMAACTQVDNGNAAVRTVYGKTDGRSYGPGLYWYNPWSTDYVSLSTQQEKKDISTASYTKDAQQATVSGTVTYHLDPKRAHVIYSTVGMEWAEKIVPAIVLQAIKNEFGRWDAMSVIANRGQLQNNIQLAITQKLATRNIVLDGFELTNIDYSDAFEGAVEAKTVATQTAIAEQNKTVAVSERAKQAVITAKGEAEAMQVRAQALASNPKLVEYEAVQKWNGVLPSYMMGSSTPFINLQGR